MQSKVEAFELSLREFLRSPMKVQDFMLFLPKFHSIIKQGSGLTWTTIQEVLEDVINPKLVEDTVEGEVEEGTYYILEYYLTLPGSSTRRRDKIQAEDVWKAIDKLNDKVGYRNILQSSINVILSPKKVDKL